MFRAVGRGVVAAAQQDGSCDDDDLAAISGQGSIAATISESLLNGDGNARPVWGCDASVVSRSTGSSVSEGAQTK